MQLNVSKQNNCSSGKTTFEGLRVPKGSFSIRKTSGYKLRAYNLIGTEDNKCQSPLCPSWSKRWQEKMRETFQEIPVECSNGSEAPGYEHDLENYGN